MSICYIGSFDVAASRNDKLRTLNMTNNIWNKIYSKLINDQLINRLVFAELGYLRLSQLKCERLENLTFVIRQEIDHGQQMRRGERIASVSGRALMRTILLNLD